jgi:acyl-CoA thioesterase
MLLILNAEPAEGHWSFVVEPHLCRVDGRLYGGAALAAALAASEAATGRSPLWCTTQLAGTAEAGEQIEIRSRSVAHGGTIDQFMVTGLVDDRLVFQALGAAGATPRTGMNARWGSMPPVEPPEACGPLADRILPSMESGVGHHLACEQRLTAPYPDARGEGRLAAWARPTGDFATNGWSTQPAALAFLADLVPLAISEAAGISGAGASLDNTIRIGERADCEWVLIDLDAQMAIDGVGHGQSRIWSPDGALLAIGSQTARMFTYDDFAAKLGS